MARVSNTVATRRRRKKILKMAKGYFGSKRTLYRTANEQVMRSLNYSYVSRKLRKRDFRKLWIQRINAACKLNDYKYSKLIFGLTLANVQINRKMLADMAYYDQEGFKQLIELSKEAINNAPTKEKAPLQQKLTLEGIKEAPKKVVPVKEEVKKDAKPEVKAEAKVEVKKEEKAVDLNAMTVAELKELAKSRELTGYSALKKAELIDLLK